MAASLLAMLSQQAPNLPVRKGLLLTGLQHDFLSPDGKLPVNNLASGFLDRTMALVKAFRGHGDIIWVRTEIDASRDAADFDEDYCNVITCLDQHDPSESGDESEEESSESEAENTSRKRNLKDSAGETGSDSRRKQPRVSHGDNVASTSVPAAVDQEHYLTQTSNREACFIKGTDGPEFGVAVKSSVLPTDLQVADSCYSAFCSTSLLSMLRSKLITELFVCGAMSNLNVYATSTDAARYGIKITLVEDCLGYRERERHDLAIKRLVGIMEADVVMSDDLITSITGGKPAAAPKHEESVGTRISLGASIDPRDGMLEVASSDEEDDDDDLLLVRSSYSPLQTGRPLAIRGRGPQTSDLQALETGSEPYPQLQRHASPKPIESPSTGEREAEDNVEHSRKIETVEFKDESSSKQPRLTSGSNDMGFNAQIGDNVTLEQSPNYTMNVERSLSPTLSSAAAPKQHERVKKPVARPNRRRRKNDGSSVVERMDEQPLFGPGKEEESSQSSMQYDLLPSDRLDGLFQKLKEEVSWQRMHHQKGEVPRLVCCQGTINPDGSMPVYRHPSDETLALLPWTSAVDEIRRAAEAAAGHSLNHALIQLYRTGTDYISEHSDKTLDIAPSTFIVNASFGAERVMRLRTKRGTGLNTANVGTPGLPTQDSQRSRTTHRVRLPHNSALLMSLATNAKFLHSINPDKRSASELTPAEKAYEGQRISLTFRNIATFLDAESKHIWGQGAIGKHRHEARKAIVGRNYDAADAVEKLVKGFGAENAASEIQWNEWYGDGSDVLHLK